jgi:hypothetical protein
MDALLNELKGELLQVFEHLHKNATGVNFAPF